MFHPKLWSRGLLQILLNLAKHHLRSEAVADPRVGCLCTGPVRAAWAGRRAPGSFQVSFWGLVLALRGGGPPLRRACFLICAVQGLARNVLFRTPTLLSLDFSLMMDAVVPDKLLLKNLEKYKQALTLKYLMRPQIY